MLKSGLRIFLRVALFAVLAGLWPVAVLAVADDVPAPAGMCPQARRTPAAPEEYLKLHNPLEPTAQNILAGKTLFHLDAKPTACRICHGFKGDGMGMLFRELTPKPRNFTCYETMKDLADGQLFWIIKNGSPDSRMPSFKNHLEDDQVWQLVLYLRRFHAMPPE
jgi:mono/diheme cytochrome c family protein